MEFKKSVLLSLFFVCFFIVTLMALETLAPWIVEWFLSLTNKSINLQPIPVGFLYACLLRVIKNTFQTALELQTENEMTI